MSRATKSALIAAGLGLGLCGLASPVVADLANVYPKQGSPLRGDVTWTASEILIRNAAGEVRLKKEDVERVEWLMAAKTVDADFLRRFQVLAARDVDGHYALAEWLRQKKRFDLLKKQCNYVLGLEPDHRNAKLLLELAQRELVEQANVETPEAGREQAERAGAQTAGLTAPPLLSKADIKRLKLYEYPLDGAPPKVHVRFTKKRDFAPLERIVRAELGRANELDSEAERILDRGQPQEKLQLVLRATGLKYADRIEIRGDTPVFKTFRQRVLPLVMKGCTRTGCHGAREARVFRLPSGSRSKDEVAYTTFLILDQLETRHGPLIDRDLPGNSVLLGFMLPVDENNDQPHPPVEKGRLAPVLKSSRDRNFQVVLDWLDSLSVPHPEYELEYKLPDWLKRPQPAEPAAPEQPGEKAAPESKPGEQKPPPDEKPKDKPGGGGGRP